LAGGDSEDIVQMKKPRTPVKVAGLEFAAQLICGAAELKELLFLAARGAPLGRLSRRLLGLRLRFLS
jgi:hypothetical protein